MRYIVMLLMGGFVILSCRLEPSAGFPDKECRGWCATQKLFGDHKPDDYFVAKCIALSDVQVRKCEERCRVKAKFKSFSYIPPYASMIKGDIRCHHIVQEAIGRGIKMGLCYGGNLTKEEGGRHPYPEKCQALRDEAQKKCEKLPPDPRIDYLASFYSNSFNDYYHYEGGYLTFECSGFPGAGKCEDQCEVRKLKRLSSTPLFVPLVKEEEDNLNQKKDLFGTCPVSDIVTSPTEECS